MKQLLPFLLVCFFACGDKQTKEIPYTIIKGKITYLPLERITVNGLDADEIAQKRREIGLVSNAIRSGLDVPNHNGLLDADGNFHFIIKINEPTEIRLKYNFKNIPIYAEPGNEIIVDIDFTQENNPHTFSGDNLAFNQKISEYDQLFKDSFRVELNATLPYVIPREFKDQRAKITKRIRRFTQQFIQENATNNSILANWVNNHAEYRIAMDYMKYAFRNLGFNQYSPHFKANIGDHYFDFWEAFPVDNSNSISNLNYQNYLQFYRKYLMAKLRQTTPYQDCVNLPTCNEFEMEVAQLGNTLTGRTRDLTLSQQADYHLIRNNAAFLKNGFDYYLQEIADSTIIEDLLTRKEFLYQERKFEFSDKASLIQTDASGKEILNTIIQGHSNDATLLYFWNTQRDIVYRYYRNEAEVQEVWKKMDSLGIQLVLLAHHSTPNIWKEKIAANGLIGDLWHLTDEQFSFFEDYFHKNRQPHINYDKIYDRENFLLLIDGSQHLNTIDDISFRERNFTWLTMLPRQFKYLIEKQRRTQITAE